MSRAASSSSTTSGRSSSITWATILTLIVGLGNLVFLLPGMAEDIPRGASILAAVLGVSALLACWGLWQCRRWGMIAAMVLAVINIVFSIPPIFDGSSGLVTAAAAISIPLSLGAIYLMTRSEARARYR